MNQNFRRAYHEALCQEMLFIDKHGVPSNANKHHGASTLFGRQIIANIGVRLHTTYISLRIAQERFERITSRYLEDAFKSLNHLRPGKWLFYTVKNRTEVSENKQLDSLEDILATNRKFRTLLVDYNIVKPDIIIARVPVEDKEINQKQKIVDDNIATHTPLRKKNSTKLIHHASISCNWIIHSGPSKAVRTETLNLMGNRKGHFPHTVAVTAEPLPIRIATLALGTDDIDCVYHFALHELRSAVEKFGNQDQLEMLITMIEGHRLRDISDLPFDLAT
jgi:hypothetical protein